MTTASHQTIYRWFYFLLPWKPNELDIAYAIEDTMNRYGLSEQDVKWIIRNESQGVYGD